MTRLHHSISNRLASLPRMMTALAWITISLATLAQTEQWLEYHTGPETKGYRWLDLSTNPPPNIPLPELKPGAWYGRWTNAMDATGGRWFCLDRSRRSGPCDRIIFDTNGNGRLDDDAPIPAARTDDYMGWFEPIKLLFKGEDGPVTYHLSARFYQFAREPARLLAGSAGWYEGNVTLAGKKHRIQLVDNTVNGVFNDVGETESDSDRIVITGQETPTRCLGRYLEIDGVLLKIEVARDGAFLKVEPASNVTFAKVRVPETITRFTAVGENGHFIRKPAGEEFELPAGDYRVKDWEITRKDDKGAKWTLTGYGSSSRAASFHVNVGQTPALRVGEPVYAALQLTETRSELAFSLQLLGGLGETIQMLLGENQPRAPQLQVAGAGFKATRNFEYG